MDNGYHSQSPSNGASGVLQCPYLSEANRSRRVTWSPPMWAAFVLLVLAAIAIAFGVPMGPVAAFAGMVGLLFAYRYPYATFGLFIALVPFMGITVSLPTGALAFGERAFGGSIDMTVVELVAMALLAAWATKVLLLWMTRNDVNWKPWLPLALPMLALVAAHALSAFSPYQPDQVLVWKYTLRPVLWCYLIYVALTVNLIRSRHRLAMVLGIVAATGIFAALMGFVSLGIPDTGGHLLPRAHPLPLFGITPLGDNHNLLAEWLAVTVPSTLALLLLTRSARSRRLLSIATGFQTIVLLLTFSRTGWIVFVIDALLLGFFVWREQFDRWIRQALLAAVLLLPLAAAMFAFSSTSAVQSSTSTRAMLTGIAVSLWQASPIVGMGAGTFVDRVGSTRVFLIEYGAPLDSHGLIQKLLAETGAVGILALAWFVVAAFRFVRDIRQRLAFQPLELHVFTILAVSSFGALIYQLFNTNYWSGKLWLPLGIMLAASRALMASETDRTDGTIGS